MKPFSQLVKAKPLNTFLKHDSVIYNDEYNNLIPNLTFKINKYLRRNIKISVPKIFEGKKVWKEYLSTIYNQKGCGSCWSFAPVACLSDRFNLFTLGYLHMNLSPVRPIICDFQGIEILKPFEDPESVSSEIESIVETYGCKGNTLSEGWKFLYLVGTNTEECLPLSILDYETLPSCIKITGPLYDMCSNYFYNYYNDTQYGTPAKFYSAYHVYAIPGTPNEGGSEYDIREEIFKSGPVTSSMEVYEDFYYFNPNQNIYDWNGVGERIGGHAVVIDGWGEEDGVKYWWIRNSWGPDWGIDGYFKMVRGKNCCRIEENVITGLPNINGMSIFSNVGIPWQELPKDIINKQSGASSNNLAGGIDIVYGYSRRIMSYDRYKPFIKKYDGPIADYNTFIAGNIQTKEDFKIIELERSNTNIIFLLILLVMVLIIIKLKF